MKYELTLKTFVASKRFNTLITRYTSKLKRKLHNFSNDLVGLTIIIKKHEKNHFFSGRFSLQLPIKSLNATAGGASAESVLTEGFEKLLKEYELYKGTRFKGSSKYRYHESIRDPDVVLPVEK